MGNPLEQTGCHGGPQHLAQAVAQAVFPVLEKGVGTFVLFGSEKERSISAKIADSQEGYGVMARCEFKRSGDGAREATFRGYFKKVVQKGERPACELGSES
jgi:hypothetical protein